MDQERARKRVRFDFIPSGPERTCSIERTAPEFKWEHDFLTDEATFLALCSDLWDPLNIVCYGMIENIPVSPTPTATIIEQTSLVDVYLNEDRTIQRRLDGATVGSLEETTTSCICKLAREENIEIQLMLKTTLQRSGQRRGNRVIALVSANIYGPENLADDVGDFLDECNFYLQDPVACNRNVPYKNPHCLSTLFEAPSMTFDLPAHINDGDPEFSVDKSLQIIGTTESLSFFLNRESNRPLQHIWFGSTDANGSSLYTNGITYARQYVSPPLWSGGILADEMGLGKTLQMLSLIAYDKEIRQQSNIRYEEALNEPGIINGRVSTLIIVPLALMGVWEYQLKHHLRPNFLTWKKHYGGSRLKRNELYDIVITTYATVLSEYNHHRMDKSVLFGCHWRRIILDEAHTIRNWRTVISNAVSSLNASSRWAVSGTPIQNGLEDLVGLLKFLRFQPYDDPSTFDKDIVSYFREGNIDEGTRRLKALCDPIMIRRPKTVISLPPRQDLLKTVDFSPEEISEYFKIEGRLGTVCEEEEATNATAGHAWMTTIQLISKLRIFCNLGLSTKPATLAADNSQMTVTTERRDSIEAIVASEVALGGVKCAECQNAINIPDTLVSVKVSSYAYYSNCRRVYCKFCAELKSYQITTGCGCAGSPSPCLLGALSPALVQEAQYGQQCDFNAVGPISSKVKVLVQEVLCSLPEKNVVLSFWTASLNMVQQALEAAGVRCTRIDGSLSQPERERRLRLFKTDQDIQAILLTISCGGVGLDLTAASRVHLLEPQWNPAVEDQALARVHRMGQQRPVVTIRYVMKHSIEQSIATVKDKKQMLAELLPRTACHTNMNGSPDS
ncbi:SNF2 family N-terminal domain-containing protein [Biscogniauxia marginata]|nr:SNF2 family N-terminal domain-containing protein [Biscogniauxia marginata]